MNDGIRGPPFRKNVVTATLFGALMLLVLGMGLAAVAHTRFELLGDVVGVVAGVGVVLLMLGIVAQPLSTEFDASGISQRWLGVGARRLIAWEEVQAFRSGVGRELKIVGGRRGITVSLAWYADPKRVVDYIEGRVRDARSGDEAGGTT